MRCGARSCVRRHSWRAQAGRGTGSALSTGTSLFCWFHHVSDQKKTSSRFFYQLFVWWTRDFRTKETAVSTNQWSPELIFRQNQNLYIQTRWEKQARDLEVWGHTAEVFPRSRWPPVPLVFVPHMGDKDHLQPYTPQNSSAVTWSITMFDKRSGAVPLHPVGFIRPQNLIPDLFLSISNVSTGSYSLSSLETLTMNQPDYWFYLLILMFLLLRCTFHSKRWRSWHVFSSCWRLTTSIATNEKAALDSVRTRCLYLFKVSGNIKNNKRVQGGRKGDLWPVCTVKHLFWRWNWPERKGDAVSSCHSQSHE